MQCDGCKDLDWRDVIAEARRKGERTPEHHPMCSVTNKPALDIPRLIINPKIFREGTLPENATTEEVRQRLDTLPICNGQSVNDEAIRTASEFGRLARDTAESIRQQLVDEYLKTDEKVFVHYELIGSPITPDSSKHTSESTEGTPADLSDQIKFDSVKTGYQYLRREIDITLKYTCPNCSAHITHHESFVTLPTEFKLRCPECRTKYCVKYQKMFEV